MRVVFRSEKKTSQTTFKHEYFIKRFSFVCLMSPWYEFLREKKR